MTIPELLTLASNKLAALNNARNNAVAIGDISKLFFLDAEIMETQDTIDKLKLI